MIDYLRRGSSFTVLRTGLVHVYVALPSSYEASVYRCTHTGSVAFRTRGDPSTTLSLKNKSASPKSFLTLMNQHPCKLPRGLSFSGKRPCQKFVLRQRGEIDIHTYRHTFIHTYIHTHISIQTYRHTYIHTCMHTISCVYIDIYTHILIDHGLMKSLQTATSRPLRGTPEDPFPQRAPPEAASAARAPELGGRGPQRSWTSIRPPSSVLDRMPFCSLVGQTRLRRPLNRGQKSPRLVKTVA